MYKNKVDGMMKLGRWGVADETEILSLACFVGIFHCIAWGSGEWME
jgi:aminoglycoside phosphotransferase